MKNGAHASFRASSPGPPQRRKMDPNLAQNEAKMESKWGQSCIKMEPKSNPKLMKHFVNIFMFLGVPARFPNVFSHDLSELF